jgi:Secreted repeat of unknown function
MLDRGVVPVVGREATLSPTALRRADPLYGFVKDTGPRQTHGEGLKAFGAEWYVLNGAGRKVEEHGS